MINIKSGFATINLQSQAQYMDMSLGGTNIEAAVTFKYKTLDEGIQQTIIFIGSLDECRKVMSYVNDEIKRNDNVNEPLAIIAEDALK